MQIGIHLPQYGRVASPEAVRRAAQHAEALGFHGVWVSDHIVHPAAQDYPSPYLYDPLVTLTYAAAVTEHVALGTSVLVLPHHNPLELANALASLDRLSGGRVVVGAGVGWSELEFAALGYDFANRGERTDEIVEVLRACWRDDPTEYHGEHYSFADLRVLPKPAHDIRIWVGGSGAAARRRAITKGDGFQLIGVTPDEAAPVIEALRKERPEPEFTISLRTGWDPQGMETERIEREYGEYEAAGVQYVVSAPWRSDLDGWLRSMEMLASLTGLEPR
jgi:probable F420-dependent oxidoreductase